MISAERASLAESMDVAQLSLAPFGAEIGIAVILGIAVLSTRGAYARRISTGVYDGFSAYAHGLVSRRWFVLCSCRRVGLPMLEPTAVACRLFENASLLFIALALAGTLVSRVLGASLVGVAAGIRLPFVFVALAATVRSLLHPSMPLACKSLHPTTAAGLRRHGCAICW